MTDVKIDKMPDGVTRICRPLDRTRKWESWFLLSSDRHHDNPHTRQDLEKQHLDQCVEREALVLDFGDLFCAMQGNYDPRKSKSSIRPEHNVDNYLDALVEDAASFYRPYRDNIALISQGNHETNIVKRMETDLTQRLIGQLNVGAERPIAFGGYHGWIILRFRASGGGKQHTQSLVIKYHHGYGGGGPVTKGTIQANRRAVIWPDADIIASGHIHEHWTMEYTRERINPAGTVTCKTQTHVSLPTYKEEYHGARSGFHVERGRPPKPLGAVWLRVFLDRDFRLDYELTRAK